MPIALPLNTQAGDYAGMIIHCPACGYGHFFDKRWEYNGNPDQPTFSPSMLVYGYKSPDGSCDHPRCHSYVRDGKIQYLGDCEHAMKNQTVELPEQD